MYKIVVASHGKFSEGILDTIKMFTNDIENVFTLSLDNLGIENFNQNVIQLFESLKDENVLILVDLFNGTPFNVCYKNIDIIKGDKDIIAGVNLPILLDVLLNSSYKSVKEEVESLKNTKVINILSDEQLNVKFNEDDE